MSNGDLTAQVAAQLANVVELLSPVGEAVEGYRAALERSGYPDALARRMAGDYHAALFRMLIP